MHTFFSIALLSMIVSWEIPSPPRESATFLWIPRDLATGIQVMQWLRIADRSTRLLVLSPAKWKDLAELYNPAHANSLSPEGSLTLYTTIGGKMLFSRNSAKWDNFMGSSLIVTLRIAKEWYVT